MQVAKQESWSIRVSAKSKNFNFRLKATKENLPTWKFHRCSIFLKLCKFLLRLKSDSAATSSSPSRRRSLKSRIIASVGKFRRRRAKKQSVTTKETQELTYPEVKSPVNRLKHLRFGILAFLFQSIYEKDQTVILVLGSVIILLYLLTLIMKNKNITGKSKTVLAFSVITLGTVVCLVVFGLEKFLNYHQGCVFPEFDWKTWKLTSRRA